MKLFKNLRQFISYLFLICLTTILYVSDSCSGNPASFSDPNVPQNIYNLEDPF